MEHRQTSDRQRWMAVLARASTDELANRMCLAPPLPPHTVLRGPETGLIMIRGRAGGGGAVFNQGEMTVTRCTVRAGDHIGHAYIAGREPIRAELAARLDAALQDETLKDMLMREVVSPLAQAQQVSRAEVAARAAATRVEFFTLATMRS